MKNQILSLIVIIFLISCTSRSNRAGESIGSELNAIDTDNASNESIENKGSEIISDSATNNIVESKRKGLYVIDLDKADNQSKDIFLYSTFYKGSKAILLETNKSCLIGRIDKIQVFDQKIFILDIDMAKSLYIFDMEGHFIRKIGNTGGGPGEYASPSDFTIDRENKIVYVLDSRMRRINKYDISSGIFIHSIQLERNVRSKYIEYVGGNLYADAYFDTDNSSNYLLRIIHEPSGKDVGQFFNAVNYQKGYTNSSSFVIRFNAFYLRANGNAVFVQPYMDHILEIGRDSVFSLIDIKGKELLTSADIKRAMEKGERYLFRELFQYGKYFQIRNFIENDKMIIFNFQKGITFGITISLNKQTNEVKIMQRFLDDILYGDKERKPVDPVLLLLGCYDGNGVYYYTEQVRVPDFIALAKAGLLSPDLDKLEEIKKLEEDTNPILFYYEFKE